MAIIFDRMTMVAQAHSSFGQLGTTRCSCGQIFRCNLHIMDTIRNSHFISSYYINIIGHFSLSLSMIPAAASKLAMKTSKSEWMLKWFVAYFSVCVILGIGRYRCCLHHLTHNTHCITIVIIIMIIRNARVVDIEFASAIFKLKLVILFFFFYCCSLISIFIFHVDDASWCMQRNRHLLHNHGWRYWMHHIYV